MKMEKLPTNRGSSTLELLLACALFTLFFSATISVIYGNRALLQDTHINIETLARAAVLLEEKRGELEENFWFTPDTQETQDGVYTLQTKIEILDGETKKITARVSRQSGARTVQTTLYTVVTNYKDHSDCDALPTNDWTRPAALHFPTTTLIPGVSARLTDVAIYKNHLYLASKTASGSTNTLFVFTAPSKASDQPVYVGGIDTIPSVGSAGISALAFTGNYALVASGYGANFTTCSEGANCAQLQTIDLSDAAHPSVVRNIKIPGVSGAGGQGAGKTVFYYRGHVYVGLTKTGSGAEFHIFDVGAQNGSPTHPVWEGSYTVGRTINKIRVRDSFAYLATDDNTREVIVLDVSDKTRPTLAGVFNPPGSTNFGFGYDLFIATSTLYVGRSYVGNAPEWYALNNTDPYNLLVTSSIDTATSTTPDSINALVVEHGFSFLLTNTGFDVWSTAGNKLATVVLPGAGTALACVNSSIYAVTSATSSAADTLSVITPL